MKTTGWGTIPRMVNLIGAPRTKRAILLTERLGMQQALEWGFIDDIAPAGQALAQAKELAVRAGQRKLYIQRTNERLDSPLFPHLVP